jgi:hypothetical protein
VVLSTVTLFEALECYRHMYQGMWAMPSHPGRGTERIDGVALRQLVLGAYALGRLRVIMSCDAANSDRAGPTRQRGGSQPEQCPILTIDHSYSRWGRRASETGPNGGHGFRG